MTCVRNWADAVARLMSISSDFLFSTVSWQCVVPYKSLLHVLFCSRPMHALHFHAGMNRRWRQHLTSLSLCPKIELLCPTWWALSAQLCLVGILLVVFVILGKWSVMLLSLWVVQSFSDCVIPISLWQVLFHLLETFCIFGLNLLILLVRW